jgi:hypothetical protein
MAKTHEEIERYIISSDIEFQEVGHGTWVLEEAEWGGTKIVVQHTDPLVIFRCKLFEVPECGDSALAELFGTLLALNATDMVQGAYALEAQSVVVVECLQAENLDENEFLAAIDCITLAIVEHHDQLEAMLPSIA